MGTSKSAAVVVAGFGVASVLVLAFALNLAFLGSRGCGAPSEPPPPPQAAPPSSPRPANSARRADSSDAAAASTTDAKSGGTAVVRVTSGRDGAAVADAEVNASCESFDRVTARSDAAGVARFDALEPSKWTFRASVPGWLSSPADITIEKSAESRVSLRLTPAAALVVRVEEAATGRGVPDAPVEIDVVGSGAKDNGRTGDDGERLFAVPAESVLRVNARAEGLVPASETVRIPRPGKTSTVTVRLSGFVTVSGFVRAPDGTAVASATVTVQQRGGRRFTATTDPTGRYRIVGLLPGREYSLAASGPGSPWAPSALVTIGAPAGGDVTRHLTLQSRGSVVVRVRDESRSIVADATLTRLERGLRPEAPREPGVFELREVDPGPLGLSIGFGSTTETRTIDVPAGGLVELDLRPTSREQSMWTVEDETGRPVAGADIQFRSSWETIGYGCKVTTDGEGRAQVHSLQGLRFHIDVVAPGHQTFVREWTRDEPVARTLVVRRSATLRFRLIDASGVPATFRAEVFIDGGHAASTESEANDSVQKFEVEPRPAAEVVILPVGHAASVHRVSLVAGAVTDLGDIPLTRRRTVRGRVVDADGSPVPSAAASAWTSLWRPAGQGAKPNREPLGVADDDGTFDVDFAPQSGPLPLVIDADGFARLRTIVDVTGDEPLTITLPRGGLVWGEAVSAAGVPLGGAQVLVADGAGRNPVSQATDEHGNFDLRLPSGRYTLRADGCNDVAVELRDGADEHVRIVARPK